MDLWSVEGLQKYFCYLMGLFYEYFADGIANSGIRQFGGDECYNEIPPNYHWAVSITAGSLALLIIWGWRRHLGQDKASIKQLGENVTEKVCFWLGLLSFIFTFYFKVITKRGFFMLNPCHIALLFMLILLKVKDNTNIYARRLHTAWTAWLLGPFGALAWPHLEEISMFQFVLYFVEHLIILPIGPIVLSRRYGNLFPNFTNQIASYATILVFQMLVLMPLSRYFRINLNFTLCHSPSEPYFDDFGYHYYTIEIFNVCWISYAVRLTSYLIVRAVNWIGTLGIKSKEE